MLALPVTESRLIEEYRSARAAIIGSDRLPASTLLIIDGLAHPDMLVEVEVEAEAWTAKG